ncbi:TetR/AcrR family transcriptional regulator [Streptomyces parvus]
MAGRTRRHRRTAAHPRRPARSAGELRPAGRTEARGGRCARRLRRCGRTGVHDRGPLPGRLATPRSTVLPCCEVDRLVSRRRQNGRVVRVTDGQQTRNAERTRRAVLDAAVQVILHKGAAVPLAQVAAAAGVSKSGLIHHFGSRDQLVVALVEDTHERLRETVRSHLDLSENYPGDAPRVRSRGAPGPQRPATSRRHRCGAVSTRSPRSLRSWRRTPRGGRSSSPSTGSAPNAS